MACLSKCERCGEAVDPWWEDKESSGCLYPFNGDFLFLHKSCATRMLGQDTKYMKCCENCLFMFDAVSCRNCPKQKQGE